MLHTWLVKSLKSLFLCTYRLLAGFGCGLLLVASEENLSAAERELKKLELLEIRCVSLKRQNLSLHELVVGLLCLLLAGDQLLKMMNQE